MSELDGTLEEQLGHQRFKNTLLVLNRVSREPPGSPAENQNYRELFGELKVGLDFFFSRPDLLVNMALR